ncbi:hypothetical protein IQ37_12710 [Chryseobacterium piperi]|uniref:Lipoprotein n=1 Tax=Chryseobacterium piperi TaxID=558152 RepID=A0A086B8J5_9FLAO|nr:hypothetical protein [Chryseobacterium piperi]ASW74884.1 hypothetical protein CJF12_11730 [Chryseobacterium piperi]KFF25259.1 hypothetical protein IQ37_12710 [Chryseobacterium piperi]
MNRIVSFMSIGALLLASCSSPKKTSMDKTQDTKNVKIEFTGTDNFMIKNSKLKVSLYGVPANIADVPATLITEKEFTQEKVPFSVELPLPENPESLIEPKVDKGAAVKYYVTINWDANGSGVEDKGDIVIDYDKKFPTVTIDGNSQQIYLKESK